MDLAISILPLLIMKQAALPTSNLINFGLNISLASRNYKQIFVDSNDFSELYRDKPVEDDFLSFQEVRFHNKFWRDPKPGSIEIFYQLGTVFYVVSAAQVRHNFQTYQHSYGVAISNSSGFIYERHEVIFVEDSKEAKGGMCVIGKIHGKRIAICGVHGEWDEDKGGYENENNLKMIINIILTLDEIPFVILGDFNLTWELVSGLGRYYPHVTVPYNKTYTFYDDVEGWADPDHYVLGRLKLLKKPEYVQLNSDHFWLENIVTDLVRCVN